MCSWALAVNCIVDERRWQELSLVYPSSFSTLGLGLTTDFLTFFYFFLGSQNDSRNKASFHWFVALHGLSILIILRIIGMTWTLSKSLMSPCSDKFMLFWKPKGTQYYILDKSDISYTGKSVHIAIQHISIVIGILPTSPISSQLPKTCLHMDCWL